ncbi:restriction endonuclease subunit S [Enterococcus hulanensis]|uniref:restriction endonuclease subunit S n=1 Tax=Enterococcus hulanensis TaxID=2559929 RepID=UPI002890A89D|nr:restriction endonuclease subunit S [Enterococcus hulanensis]MDT2659245.1 restriction endonuclease subunit S [Enterococcus hulanensis]
MKKVSLHEVTSKIGSGATPRGGKNAYQGGEYSLIRSMNVFDDFFNRFELAKINEDQATKLNNVAVQEGDVLINITGASVARVNIVPKDILPARVNQHVSIIRPIREKLYNNFLHYYLVQPVVKQKLLAIALGSSREAITKDSLENFQINLPNLKNQVKIADILSILDKKIQLNDEINSELKKIAQKIYDYWFIGFNFPNVEGHPYYVNDGEMIYSKELKRDIPANWDVKKLRDIASVVTGKTPSTKNIKNYSVKDYMFIGPEELTNNPLCIEKSAKYISQYGFDSIKSNTISGESILVSSIGVIGRIGFTNHIVATNQQINSLTNFVSSNLSYYVYFYLKSISQSLHNLAGNTVIPIMAKSTFEQIKIIIPDDKTLTSFTNQVQPLFKKIQKNSQESVELAKLRDWLLPMLMNGQVTVLNSNNTL